MTRLQAQLDATQTAFRSQVPTEVLAKIDKAMHDLTSSDILNGSLQVGDFVPDFTLPNHQGEFRQLSSLLKKGPLVISFYRGGWCPYCNLELAALQAILPEIKACGAGLIAITPETPDHSLNTAEKNDLSFEVLSDQGNAVARQFGLEFVVAEELRPIYQSFGLDIPAFNGDASFTLPIPATYVVGSDGKVIYKFADVDYSKRAEPGDLLNALGAG